MEGTKKAFKLKTNKIQPIRYTPDFVGEGWIIEVKGMRHKDFDLRWKMLKKYFTDLGVDMKLYLPRTLKHVEICVQEIVKNARSKPNRRNKKVLLDSENQLVAPKRTTKPKVSVAKGERVSRGRGKGLL